MTVVPRGQVHGRHGPDALSVQDDILGADAELGPHGVPRRLDVGVQVLLARPTAGHPVAGIVVAEDVAVDPAAQPQVEARHLPQVHGVSVRVEDGEARVWRALDEHAGDPVAARRACVEHLEVLLLAVRVLPFRLVRQVQLLLVCRPLLILQKSFIDKPITDRVIFKSDQWSLKR